jgi:transposase
LPASTARRQRGRRFGVTPRTVRRWRKRWRLGGLEGLVPCYPHRRGRRVSAAAIELIGHARRDMGYGAARTRLWLARLHHIKLAMATIQRIFRELGMAHLRRTPKRAPRQLKLFEKPEPGDSVQVDVKFVKIAGRWAFQYTALDDCTRSRVVRLYRRHHQSSSLSFLAELRRLPLSDPPAAVRQRTTCKRLNRSRDTAFPLATRRVAGPSSHREHERSQRLPR